MKRNTYKTIIYIRNILIGISIVSTIFAIINGFLTTKIVPDEYGWIGVLTLLGPLIIVVVIYNIVGEQVVDFENNEYIEMQKEKNMGKKREGIKEYYDEVIKSNRYNDGIAALAALIFVSVTMGYLLPFQADIRFGSWTEVLLYILLTLLFVVPFIHMTYTMLLYRRYTYYISSEYVTLKNMFKEITFEYYNITQIDVVLSKSYSHYGKYRYHYKKSNDLKVTVHNEYTKFTLFFYEDDQTDRFLYKTLRKKVKKTRFNIIDKR